MNTNFDSLDRHTDWQKIHRHYLNTQDTDIQTDIIFIVQVMNMADGAIEFVCLMFFLLTDFCQRFSWHMVKTKTSFKFVLLQYWDTLRQAIPIHLIKYFYKNHVLVTKMLRWIKAFISSSIIITWRELKGTLLS